MRRRKSRVLPMAWMTELRKQVFPRLRMPGWKEGSYSLVGLEYLELEAANEPPRRPGMNAEVDDDDDDDDDVAAAVDREPLAG